MTKAPKQTEKSKKQCSNTKNANKTLDYTTIADRLSAVSWSNDSNLPSYRTGRDLTQVLYQKAPTPTEKNQKATWQHTNATKNFNYTAITDRIRMVSWGNDKHPTVW